MKMMLALILLGTWPMSGQLLTYPKNFPPPILHENIQLTPETIQLGKSLFHDNALSSTSTVSCAFCHLPDEAFSDPAIQPWGVQAGRTTRRHSMPLFNLAWKPGPFRWDGDEQTLHAQILRPISDPIELGENLSTLPAKLAKIATYPKQFQKAFGSPEITPERIAQAIEQYLLTLISSDSKYDQAQRDEIELSALEQRGQTLFFTPHQPTKSPTGAGCAQCHPAPLFTDHRFHNNGISSPHERDLGLANVTLNESDRYKFATPSLRNIAITAPYMHHGRLATLSDVLKHYSTGLNPSDTLSPHLPPAGLQLSPADQSALIAFLHTLTAPQYLESNEAQPIEGDPFAP